MRIQGDTINIMVQGDPRKWNLKIQSGPKSFIVKISGDPKAGNIKRKIGGGWIW